MTTLNDLKEGDLVPIWVQVKEIIPSQFKVEVFSKTDQYEAWIHEQHLDPNWLKEQNARYLKDHLEEMKQIILEDDTLPLADRENAARRLDVLFSDLVK